MTNIQNVEYGLWQSPITADLIASHTVRLNKVCLDTDIIYWSETRPEENGREVIMASLPNKKHSGINPQPYSSITRVHEFGGGGYSVINNNIFFSNLTCQRIYKQKKIRESDFTKPEAISPAFDEINKHLRFADITFDPKKEIVIAVQENHCNTDKNPPASLVSIDLKDSNKIITLDANSDFYSSPKLSPDGKQLAWISWNHPNMPWDESELWLADIEDDGKLANKKKITGANKESILQPEWSPSGTLHFVSDKTGWWNIYKYQKSGKIEPLFKGELECGMPHIYFGHSTYAFADDSTIYCAYAKNGIWHLAEYNCQNKNLTELDLPYQEITHIKANSEKVVFRAGSPETFVAIIEMDRKTKKCQIVKSSFSEKALILDTAAASSNGNILDKNLDQTFKAEKLYDFISPAKNFEYPSKDGRIVHGFYYIPKNQNFHAPQNSLPPLIIKIHGGPNNQTFSSLDLSIQYWTSRGFFVCDINYGGSTGFGKKYRDSLKANWGITDAEDAAYAAKYFIDQGLVDPKKIIVTGISAGGYATFNAITFHNNVFAAGIPYFGITNMETMANYFHKFQSHFLNSMIGAYPEKKELYYNRSALNFVDQIKAPLLIFQGQKDSIVPPDQADQMIKKLRERNKAYRYVSFDDEGHGFRKAKNIKKALETEYAFLCEVLGLNPLPINKF